MSDVTALTNDITELEQRLQEAGFQNRQTSLESEKVEVGKLTGVAFPYVCDCD